MVHPPSGLSREDFIRAVDHAIRDRRTRKILAGPGEGAQAGQFEQDLRTALEACGWAPFHYPSADEIPEPWRFNVFYGPALARVTATLQAADVLYGKLPRIFAAAGAMVQVTWVPEPLPERSDRNWQHAASAAAAVQNLLLATTARGMGSYWCSAPVLGQAEAMSICGIEPNLRYLGTLFFGQPLNEADEASKGWSGKMLSKRTRGEAGWCHWGD
jgi:nitroreductase